MTLLEVAKHALEAMEDAMYRADTHEFYDAKESLRYAIEQAEQQEPVAWTPQVGQLFKPDGTLESQKIKRTPNGEWEPLYTAPTPRKPLTVFEIDAIAEHLDKTTIGWATHEFAAAIEKAHGIGEQHE